MLEEFGWIFETYAYLMEHTEYAHNLKCKKTFSVFLLIVLS